MGESHGSEACCKSCAVQRAASRAHHTRRGHRRGWWDVSACWQLKDGVAKGLEAAAGCMARLHAHRACWGAESGCWQRLWRPAHVRTVGAADSSSLHEVLSGQQQVGRRSPAAGSASCSAAAGSAAACPAKLLHRPAGTSGHSDLRTRCCSRAAARRLSRSCCRACTLLCRCAASRTMSCTIAARSLSQRPCCSATLVACCCSALCTRMTQPLLVSAGLLCLPSIRYPSAAASGH